MKISAFIMVTAFFFTCGIGESNAQFSLGVQGGYNLDTFTDKGVEEGSFQLGGQARFGFAELPIILNPNADYYFNSLENVDVFQINLDVLLTFGLDDNNSIFTPYAGLGLGVTRVAFNSDLPLLGDLIDTEATDYGLNVIGGATFGTGPVQPFVQARATFGDHLAFINKDGGGGSGYMLTGGLLFRIGQ